MFIWMYFNLSEWLFNLGYSECLSINDELGDQRNQ